MRVATIHGRGAGGRSPGARLGGALGGLALAALSVLLVAGVAEAVLRAVPGPDPARRLRRRPLRPGPRHARPQRASVLYTKQGVVRKRRTPTASSTSRTSRAKPPATPRVGFFGDSYVESNQVPTEATFFRRLPALLAPRAVETFGFGLSGWGTLQAFRAFQVMAPRYDLDLAVYVFVENDPGDNAAALSGTATTPSMPYASLAEAAARATACRGASRPHGRLWYRAAKCAPGALAARAGGVGAAAPASAGGPATGRPRGGERRCASSAARARRAAGPERPPEHVARARAARGGCSSPSASSPTGSAAPTPRAARSPSSTCRAGTRCSTGAHPRGGHVAPLAPRELCAARRPAPRSARGAARAARGGGAALRRPLDARRPRRRRALPRRRAGSPARGTVIASTP